MNAANHGLTAEDLDEAARHLAATTGWSCWGVRLAIARGELDLALRLLRVHFTKLAAGDGIPPRTHRYTDDEEALAPAEVITRLSHIAQETAA